MPNITLPFSYIEESFLATLQAGSVPALIGDTGIGKTSFVRGIAKKIGSQAFIIEVNQLGDRTDLAGVRYHTDPQTGLMEQVFFPHATIRQACNYARNNPTLLVLLMFDEITRTEPDIASSVFTILTERRCGDEVFPDNIRLIVAGNDEGHVQAVDNATITRLSLYYVTPDLDTYLHVNPTLNPYIKQVLTEKPALLVCNQLEPNQASDQNEDDVVTVTYHDSISFTQLTRPRTITMLSNFLNHCGIDGSGTQHEVQLITKLLNTHINDTNLLLEDIKRYVGDTAFSAELIAKLSSVAHAALTQYAPQQANTTPQTFNDFKENASLVKALAQSTTIDEIKQLDFDASTLLYLLSFEAPSKYNVTPQQIKMAFEQRTTPVSLTPQEQQVLAQLSITANLTTVNKAMVQDVLNLNNPNLNEMTRIMQIMA